MCNFNLKTPNQNAAKSDTWNKNDCITNKSGCPHVLRNDVQLVMDILVQVIVDAAAEFLGIGWRVVLQVTIVGTDFLPHLMHVMRVLKFNLSVVISEVKQNKNIGYFLKFKTIP